MSTNLEIETKCLLTKEEYGRLLSSINGLKTYIQTNYYIDDDSLSIHQQKCGLRIREKGDEFELTLKVPQDEGKLEINQQISNILFKKFLNCRDFPDGEVKQYLSEKLNIDVSKIYILGKLVTTRSDIGYRASLISIDKSSYNGKVDYEIEAENISLDTAKKDLKEFLNKNGIECRFSKKAKLKRFLQSLNLCL